MADTQTLKPLLSRRRARATIRTTSDAPLSEVPRALRKVVRQQMLDKLSELLDVPLTDRVLEALKSWHELVDDAVATRCEPGTVISADLKTMTFEGSTNADLVLKVNAVTLRPLPVLLEVRIVVRGLVVGLKDGCVCQLETGKAKVTATMYLCREELRAYTCTLDLALALPLEPPIELCPAPPAPPPNAPRQLDLRDPRQIRV